MKIYDDSAKVKDLKDACKAVGLNANGKKVDLIERLNEYEVIRSEVEATEARLISENAAGNAGDELDSTDGIVDIPINKTADGDDDDYEPEADDDDDDMEKNAYGKRIDIINSVCLRRLLKHLLVTSSGEFSCLLTLRLKKYKTRSSIFFY